MKEKILERTDPIFRDMKSKFKLIEKIDNEKRKRKKRTIRAPYKKRPKLAETGTTSSLPKLPLPPGVKRGRGRPRKTACDYMSVDQSSRLMILPGNFKIENPVLEPDMHCSINLISSDEDMSSGENVELTNEPVGDYDSDIEMDKKVEDLCFAQIPTSSNMLHSISLISDDENDS